MHHSTVLGGKIKLIIYFLLRQLKVFFINTGCLLKYFCANIRSLIIYYAPACLVLSWKWLWSNDLSLFKDRLLGLFYPNCLTKIGWAFWSCLHVMILFSDSVKRHFEKIADDATHLLFNHVGLHHIYGLHKNHRRMSSRRNTIFRPTICKPQKRAKSFFPLFMSHFNNLRS